MRVGAVVVARLGSRRLPGKVLREVEGRPLLDYVLDRTDRIGGMDSVVVATSDQLVDEPIVEYARRRGISSHRGPADDVLARVIGAAVAHGLEAVARINADSPWLEPELIEEASTCMRRDSPDLVTNLVERHWPYGVAVEVARTDALKQIHADFKEPDYREHVTRAFYEHPDRFSILSVRPDGGGYPDLRLTIDTQEDLERFRQLVLALGPRTAGAKTGEIVTEAHRLKSAAPD